MMVVVTHFAERLWPEALRFSTETFRAGECGIIIFFICSGFIIPHRSSGAGRSEPRSGIIRLACSTYTAAVTTLLLHLVDRYPLAPRLTEDPVRGRHRREHGRWQHLLGQPLMLGQSSTLAGSCSTALFRCCSSRACARRSVALSVVLFAGALSSPSDTLKPLAVTDPDGSSRGLVVGDHAGRGRARGRTGSHDERAGRCRCAHCARGAARVLNRPEPLWFALLVLGTMFVGTVLYQPPPGRSPAGWLVRPSGSRW